MAVYAARQSSFTTGDTITAAHSNNEFNAILAAFHVSTGHTHDGTTAGDGGPLSTLYSNAISMGTGADTDIAVTFNANSNDGVITWMEDEDYFKFSDDILVDSTEKLQFRDTAIYLYSSADGQLDLVADTEIQIAATTVDINGNVDISGSLTLGGTTITSTGAELNILDGVTATASELNILDGVTSTTAELNILDGVTSTASELNILDGVTSTAAELNILDGVTATATEINIIDGDTSATSTTVADADRVVYNDAGTMKQVAVTDLDTYVSGTTKTLTNKTLTSPVLNTSVSGTAVLDEDNMASDSATQLATQQSIKAYVDAVSTGITTFVMEDDDGTEVTISNNKEIKYIGSGLTTNWTDTDNGTDGDPYDLTFTVDAAQTGITSILATDLKIGEDNETKIDFETANEIHFYANNTEQVYLADNIFGPQSDSDVDLGTTSVRWKDAYVDSVTVTDDVTIGGDLTVNGTTTTVNSTTVTIDDPIFTLGGDSAPGSDDNKDRGIEFRWHNGSAAKVGFFGYDDSESAFTFIPDASNSSEVFSGTVGNVIFGNITGTLQTAAQTNITSVGALDGGSITSGFGTIDTGSSNITTTGLISGGSLDIDDVLINGTTIGHTDDTDLLTLASGALTVAGTIEGTTITASTALVPDASGGADLGTTSLEWGDLYIADDKKIYLGSDQNFSIEYDEDGNDTTAVVAAGGVSMAPHGTSSGNGTELRFQELAANGANYVGFKAPDAISSNEVWVLPNADGSADQVLKTDGSNALSWVDQAGGGTVSLVADGAITAGKPVILTSAGKAAEISGLTEGFATENQFNGSDAINYGSPNLAIIGTNKVAVCYRDAGNSNYAVGRVAEVAANGNLTFGTAVVLNSAESNANVVGYNSSNSTVAFGYTNASSNAWYVKAGTISGTTLSLSSEGTIETSIDITQWSGMVDPDTGHFVIFHTGGGKVYATAVTISGTNTPTKAYGANITGTTTFTNSGNNFGMGMDYDTNQNRFLLTAGKDEPESAVKFWVVANSGSAFTITEVSKAVTNWKGTSNVVFDPDNNKMILSYNNTSTQFSMAQLTMASADFTIDHYIHTSISNDAAQYTSYDTDTNTIAAFIGYGGSGGTSDVASFATFTNDGSAFTQVTNGTWDTQAFFAQRGGITKTSLASLANNPIVIIMSDAGNSGYARSFTVGKTNLDNGNYLGIAAQSISDTATGSINIPGGVNENQTSLTIGNHYFTNGTGTVGLVGDSSGEQYLGKAIAADKIQLLENEGYLYGTAEGAITAGRPVQVDSDGEFSMIAETTTSYTAAVGTAVEYLNSDTILSHDVAYDTYRNKVILATHPSSAGVLRVYVGTVTGGTTNSISWGSAQNIYTKNGDSVKIAYDPVSYQTMVTWVNSSNAYIDAVVITEDGDNTITAGAILNVEGGATDRRHDVVNVGERKWVICYRDHNDTYYKTRVLTTSGTTITAETETVIKSSAVVRFAVAYNSSDSQLGYFWNESTSGDLKAAVASLSGNSIGSLGTEQTLTSGAGSLCNGGSAVYDASSGKFVCASRKMGNEGEITTFTAATSDNAISSIVNGTFESGETCAGIQVLAEYNKVHICYGDRDDSTKGKIVDTTIATNGTATFGTYQEFFGSTLHFSNSPVDSNVDLGICFDSDTKRFIVAYSDDATNDGFSVVGSLIGDDTTTNMATDGESYIGIATKTVADNAQAEVATFGQIDAQQNGLTAGQKYFVQSDGSLATSADSSDPGSGITMVAGKALSATKLLISE